MRGSAGEWGWPAGPGWRYATILLICAALAGCQLSARQAASSAPPSPSAKIAGRVSAPPDPGGGKLVLAAEDDAEPWSNPDGSGYANDVVRAAYAETGLTVEILVAPYARCKQMALDGEVAACFSMSPAPELEGRIVLADEPLFECESDFYECTERPLKVSQAGELPRGTRVGVVIGYEYPPEIRLLEESGTLVLEAAASEEINLRKLAQGRLDAALVNHNEVKSVRQMIENAGATGKVAFAFPCGRLRSFIGFSLEHPRGREALESFNKGMAALRAKGALDSLGQVWRVEFCGGAPGSNPGQSGTGLHEP